MQAVRDNVAKRGSRTAVLAATCALAALLGSACASVGAASAPVAPPLEVPQPPARAFLPPEEPLPAEAFVPEAPVPAITPVPVRPSTPRRAGGSTAESEPRPEAAPSAAPAGAPDPSRELRPGSAAEDAQAERAVREMLARSTRDLGRVNVSRLSTDGRAQFEQARRFAQQADEALAARNFVFAATLADKAASLAADLVGR
jgi:hypothetical protein